ncbi:MAG: hypothetical protein RLZZ453_915 [Chlamydiota bacterium]|jgi:1,4-alpha-glucan branching enzyme
MLELIPEEVCLFNPHGVLGLHKTEEGKKKIVVFRPQAPYVYIELFGKIVQMHKKHESGLFELEVPFSTTPSDYRVYLYHGHLAHDPYTFLPTWGDVDLHLFSQGVHYKLYEKMGARVCIHQGIEGVAFAVWAPEAAAIFVVGDFNLWNGKGHPMRSLGSSGVWELFIPGLKSLEKYKFEIHTKQGHLLTKADPYAFFSEKRPHTASVVFDVDAYEWNDEEWKRQKEGPMLIYEVHLPSWKKQEEHFLNYRELALELSSYCKKMGFTHVELMGLLEHPLDESWGYQVTGFFAPTSRLGTPSDFQFFVDHMHREGIGVFIDWVPAHFPVDGHGLAQFDGSYLYEHEDPRQGFHPHWNTLIFNYGRKEVSNFLIASALFWIEKMHVDGLRVDAVASMLYLDYGRKEGEWMPNCFGGHHNLEAIEWIKHFNSILEKYHPEVHRMAEESTAFLGVTQRVDQGGLGFTMKWSLGWMNDTLHYFAKEPLFRLHHQQDLTFFLLYAFSEKYVLPLSHDEVVHGKGSLLSKMRGDDWQKFAHLRLLYSYQLCQPGKKLLFMGGELGSWEEWNCTKQLPWELLEYTRHQELHSFFCQINHFYKAHPALWEKDFSYEGFEWIDFTDRQNSVISYFRKASKEILLVVHNFTPATHFHYRLHLPCAVKAEEIFNTDRVEFGGSGKLNSFYEGHEIELTLAPLATMIFRVHCV